MGIVCRVCKCEFDEKLKYKSGGNICRKCLNEYKRNHQGKRTLEQRRLDYQTKYKKSYEKYSKKNRDKIRIRHNTKRQELKYDIMSHYSQGQPKCERCNELDIRCLSIDHIDGGGKKHLKTLTSEGNGLSFYRWLKTNNYPDGFQVLCMNCQFIKRIENNEVRKCH